jgi:type I restriction enzyme S subunit
LEVVKKGLLAELLTRGMPGRHTEFRDTEVGSFPAAWRACTLAQAAVRDGLQTGPFGSQLKASEYVESGVPVVMPKDMVDGGISDVSIARIPEHVAARLAHHRVLPGDLLFARRGEIGRCALVTTSERGWVAGTGCLRVRLAPDVHPPFLLLYLQLQVVVDWLTDHAVGQTMLNLNTEILGQTPLCLPSMDEQKEVVEGVSSLDADRRHCESELAALREVKSAILDALLSRRVRVNLSEQEAA